MSRTRRNFSAKFKSELVIEGIEDAPKQKEDFWNTINGNKVNINLLTDDDVEIVEDGCIRLIVIHVPRADFNMRPVYVGENPYKGTYKRTQKKLGEKLKTQREYVSLIKFIHSINIFLQTISFKSKFCIQQRRNIGTNIVMKYMKKSQRNGVKDIRLILLNKRKGLL